MERIKRVVITWEDENWEYELELTGAEADRKSTRLNSSHRL